MGNAQQGKVMLHVARECGGAKCCRCKFVVTVTGQMKCSFCCYVIIIRLLSSFLCNSLPTRTYNTYVFLALHTLVYRESTRLTSFGRILGRSYR